MIDLEELPNVFHSSCTTFHHHQQNEGSSSATSSPAADVQRSPACAVASQHGYDWRFPEGLSARAHCRLHAPLVVP